MTLALDEAILQTVIYADIFDYPLTLTEVQHYLLYCSAQRTTIEHAVTSSPLLQSQLIQRAGYLMLRERAGLEQVRAERGQRAMRLWRLARRWGYWVGCLPFVRLVAVTGSLAVNNPTRAADIDLLIVTEPGRVWLCRALMVLFVRLVRLTGITLCPNYMLAKTVLTQKRRDLFIAHDLTQMVPLVGHAVYQEMRAANHWTEQFLPQALTPLQAEPELSPRGIGRWLQRASEWCFAGRLGDLMDALERRRKTSQVRRRYGEIAYLSETVLLDPEHVMAYFNDHGAAVLKKFSERIEKISVTMTHA